MRYYIFIYLQHDVTTQLCRSKSYRYYKSNLFHGSMVLRPLCVLQKTSYTWVTFYHHIRCHKMLAFILCACVCPTAWDLWKSTTFVFFFGVCVPRHGTYANQQLLFFVSHAVGFLLKNLQIHLKRWFLITNTLDYLKVAL